jgi:hypothetical protein
MLVKISLYVILLKEKILKILFCVFTEECTQRYNIIHD